MIYEQINTNLNTCKSYDKDPYSCEGDCQWYEDKTKCKPLPDDTNGCCGINDRVRLNNKSIDDYKYLTSVYSKCNQKKSGACKETSECKWHSDKKKCEMPQKPVIIGCCGVKKSLRNNHALATLIETCKVNNNFDKCTNDMRAKRVCDWFTDVNDCKVEVPKNNNNNQGKKPKAQISATEGCSSTCQAKATSKCPQRCDIECSSSPITKLVKPKNSTKSHAIITDGNCSNYASSQSKIGKFCRVVKCSPGKIAH